MAIPSTCPFFGHLAFSTLTLLAREASGAESGSPCSSMARSPREHLELASEPSPRLKSGVESVPERLPSREPECRNDDLSSHQRLLVLQ